MYKVLDKDTIISEILPHLSIAKRGFVCKADIVKRYFSNFQMLGGCMYKGLSECFILQFDL